LCSEASRAYEKAKNMNINGNIIRISFSDCSKRREIIGDEPGYEQNEKTCKLLHISLNKNSQVAPEHVLRDLFKKYGNIKAMHIKNNPGFRPTIYLEYTTPEEAANAINYLVTLDHTGEKRKLIGDPSCDINYYYKKKAVMNLNDMNNPNYNSMGGMHMNRGMGNIGAFNPMGGQQGMGQNNVNPNMMMHGGNMMGNPGMMFNPMSKFII
jgi:hypothetical protein